MGPSNFLTHGEVAKRFEEYDRAGDGFITVAELRAAMDRLEREISDGIIRESIWEWDHNGDGVVDYFEFMDHFLQKPAGTAKANEGTEFDSLDALLAHCTIKHGASITESTQTRKEKLDMVKSFRKIDLDGDGFISPEELRIALTAKTPKRAADEIESILTTMFAEADKNHDGLIDMYEFSTRLTTASL